MRVFLTACFYSNLWLLHEFIIIANLDMIVINMGKEFYIFFLLITLAKVSDSKNSIPLNTFYSGICVRTKQFHSDLIRSWNKTIYSTESDFKRRVLSWLNPTQSEVKPKIYIRLNLI